MTAHYTQYQKLILSRAHSFARTTGHDLDDLIGQGNLIYCKARRTYNPGHAKFSTFLYSRLTEGLHRYTLRQDRHRHPFLELEEGTAAIAPPQLRRHLFAHHLAQLSKEAQAVVRVVLNSPLELLGQSGPNRRRMHKGVTQKLRKQGLSWAAIKKTFVSIQALAYNKCRTEETLLDTYLLPARRFRLNQEEG